MVTDNLHVVHSRAAGIDVHKMQVTVSLSLCLDKGSPEIKTRTFSAVGEGLREMTEWLGEQEVEAALMEGTGVYWQVPFEALEHAGIKALLINAKQIKQLKGRKTDVADSVWLARVCQFALGSPSHVPPKLFRDLRNMSRYRRKLVEQRSRVRNRVQKVLDRSGVRIGGIISDVFGMNGRRIIEGLLTSADKRVILDSLSSHVSAKLESLGEALSMEFNDADHLILADLVCEYDDIGKRMERFDREIKKHLKPWKQQLELLQTVPGIDLRSACAIFIEIGPDLGVFPTAKHLGAWSGLCPGNNESAGKRKSSQTRMGSKTLKSILVECAHGAVRTKDCQFHGYHKALTIRRGYKRAVVAAAHKMLRAVYAILRDKKPYYDNKADYEALMVRRNAPRWIRMLKKYGVVLEDETDAMEAVGTG